MANYIPYHMHTEYSLIDSIETPQDYIDLAVKNGMKALCFTEHGNIYNWCEKLLLCKKAGIRYLHGVEIYLTETLQEKISDNYHTILIAKNMDGLKELNRMVSLSFKPDHFYYKNRLSFEEFLNLSDNIITTSACLASPLNHLDESHPMYMRLAEKYDFLEIQHNPCDDQVVYNKRLYELAQRLGKPLIAGTDTHYSSKYHNQCRLIAMHAKNIFYDEHGIDAEFKSYEDLVEAYQRQNSLPEEVYLQAIENTNLLYDLTEEIEIDTTTIKYPISYGSPEEDSKKLREMCRTKFVDKLNRKIIPKEQKEAFGQAIKEELEVFEKLGMGGFMLSMAEMMSYIKDNNMFCGPARGSVGGSRVAYVTDIIDLNPETWNTVFSRFCNENRVEVGDKHDCLPVR